MPYLKEHRADSGAIVLSVHDVSRKRRAPVPNKVEFAEIAVREPSEIIVFDIYRTYTGRYRSSVETRYHTLCEVTGLCCDHGLPCGYASMSEQPQPQHRTGILWGLLENQHPLKARIQVLHEICGLYFSTFCSSTFCSCAKRYGSVCRLHWTYALTRTIIGARNDFWSTHFLEDGVPYRELCRDAFTLKTYQVLSMGFFMNHCTFIS